jgi:hypothetical protein
MRLLRTSIAINFILSVFIVLAWLAYAGWSGFPVDQQFMGFRPGKMRVVWFFVRRPFPAWLGPLLIELIFLGLFCIRHYVNERKIRFFIAGLSFWLLLFGVALPLLKQEVYGITFFTWDQPLWWYACISNIAYGLVGSNPEASWERSPDFSSVPPPARR